MPDLRPRNARTMVAEIRRCLCWQNLDNPPSDSLVSISLKPLRRSMRKSLPTCVRFTSEPRRSARSGGCSS